jgi:type II secretory pathway predicted ATPase ExeA
MYNSYFGFSVSPFTVTPDPNFFYSNPVYQEAYATLQYGIEAKKGFLVITGEVGTGKTTLLRKLMHNLAGTIETVFIFNTYLNFTELLQVILYDLNPTPKEPDKVKLLQELNDYLIMQLKQSRIVSVLVDEAQNLSDEALEGLRLLSNLETDQEKLIQIVLMGQPELQERLDQPSLRQLKQRVALQCRLIPLRNDEVGPYIDFRLRAAGYKGKELFNPEAVRQITSYSKGIPRLVNIICDNGLLCAYARSQKTVSAQMIDEVARDLRLGSEGQASQAETTPGALVSKTAAKRPAHPAANKVYPHNVRQIVKIGAKTVFGILVLVAVASLIDPQNFLTTAGKGLEFAAHNLNQWVLLLAPQEAVAPRANAIVKYQSKEQRVTIPRGSSVYKIANDTYGANTVLGMDLIQEFNPEIKSLNRVSAGRLLLLPSLTPETLLRKQSDGSYRLIVASFHNLTGAREYAGRLRKDGYQVTITPREISEDLLVYRIEIDGLKDFEEASQTWLTGLKNEWPRFAGTSDGTR